jgi:hypothetical protein
VTGTLPTTGSPTYLWRWMVSINGGGYMAATQCLVGSGSLGNAGASETCTVPGGTLAAGDTYSFELGVTDSASAPETSSSPGSSSVAVSSPAVAIGPAQGPVGATYTMMGSGFTASSSATVTFNSVLQSPATCSVGTFSGTEITTDGSGQFDCGFVIPSETAGSYFVVVWNVATNTSASAKVVTVTAPAITVAPGHAAVGATVTVSGTGFSVSTPLKSLVFDSVGISSCNVGSLTTDLVGAFSCSFSVPDGTSGTAVTAEDAGGQIASQTFTTTTPSSFPWLWLAVAVALAGVALATLIALRRRRAAGAAPASIGPEEAEPPSSASARPTSAAIASPEWSEDFVPTAVPQPPVPEAVAAPKIDGIAAALAALPIGEAVTDSIPTPAAASATGPETKLDIDSVLAELDEISGRILKAGPKKRTQSELDSETENHIEE